MDLLDEEILFRDYGIELPLSNLAKENWLMAHGGLDVYLENARYYGIWDYGYASHSVQDTARDEVINLLYNGARDELFSWCLAQEDGMKYD